MNLEKLHPKRRENHIYIFVDGEVAINNQNKWLDQYPIKEKKKNPAQSDAQKKKKKKRPWRRQRRKD